MLPTPSLASSSNICTNRATGRDEVDALTPTPLLKWCDHPHAASKEEQNHLLSKESKHRLHDAQNALPRKATTGFSSHVRSVVEILGVIVVVASGFKLLSFKATDQELKPSPSFSLHHSGLNLLSEGHELSSFRRRMKSISQQTDDTSPFGSDAEMERLMDVYCRGPLLHAVQMANIFEDSKHFVDMAIKPNSSTSAILEDFKRRGLAMTDDHSGDTETYKNLLRRFLDDHFDPPGADLLPITPYDFQNQTYPPMIAAIKDEEHREWAFKLHQIWLNLGRIHNTNVKSSFLPSRKLDKLNADPRPSLLVVPGGRFRETYYWDTYWIVQGLLVSDMPITARGVVNHLLEYVAEYKFVLNGGRIYYLTRSQPPMVSHMVKLVARLPVNGTEGEYDNEYLRAAVPILELEYEFWMQDGPSGHAVKLTRQNVSAGATGMATYVLNRYTANANNPRPESYREDYRIAANMSARTEQTEGGNTAATERLKNEFYNNVIAAAESGWDFSSRWMRDPMDLSSLKTKSIIPVDLNSILYQVERNLMEFHRHLGNEDRAQFFQQASANRLEAMDAILWSEKDKSWRDYDLETEAHSSVVAVSNFYPLWVKAFDASDTNRLKQVVASLKSSGLIQVGGVQTTTIASGQQWDSPNAWPPLQDIIVEGLLAVNTTESYSLARELTQKWTHTGLTAWKQTGLMFEKYNASVVGGLGSGGEYVPQFGFGWTNGVILKFLTIHQNLLTAE